MNKAIQEEDIYTLFYQGPEKASSFLRVMYKMCGFRGIAYQNHNLSKKLAELLIKWFTKNEKSVHSPFKKIYKQVIHKDFLEFQEIHNYLHKLSTTYPKSKKLATQLLSEIQNSNSLQKANELLHSFNDFIIASIHNSDENWHISRAIPRFSQYVAPLNAYFSNLKAINNEIEDIFGKNSSFWDFNDGEWHKSDALSIAHKYAKKSKVINEIADWLGRNNQLTNSYPQDFQRVKISTSVQKNTQSGKTEIEGLEYGNELSAVMPGEIALLQNKSTNTLFNKKFIDRELLQWHYHDRDSIEEKHERWVTLPVFKQTRGPMILCIDTSGSMQGLPEQAAKAAVLKLASFAFKQNRPCFLINFSVDIATLDLSNLSIHLPELINFLDHSFHGGTDLKKAVQKTLDTLENENYKDADVLIVSDFKYPKLYTPQRQAIADTNKNQGTRFFGLTIGTEPIRDDFNLFDKTWHIMNEKGNRALP